MTDFIVEDYLEPIIDESGSGQMVLKQGKEKEFISSTEDVSGNIV